MFGRFLKLAIVGIAAFVTPVHAAGTNVGGWYVSPNEEAGTCRAIRGFTDDTFLMLDYDWSQDFMDFVAMNDRWTSLESGQDVKVDIIFYSSNYLDEDWGTLNAVAGVNDGTYLIKMRPEANDFLRDVARYRGIVLKRGKVEIGNFSLDGTTEMIAELKKCALASHRRNPGDPFAK